MTLSRALLVIACCLGVAAAHAQTPPPGNSNIMFDAPGLLPKKPGAGLPYVRPQPTVWPRLDPGAVLCRTQDDLRRLADRRSGQTVDGPIDCQIIRQPTGIAIIDRESAGMTQVKTTDPKAGGTGWTDAWLPDRQPLSGASAAR